MTCRPSNATSNGSQDKSPNGPVNGRSPDEAPPNRHCLWPSYIVSWALWDVRYSCRRGGERVAFHCGTYEKRANVEVERRGFSPASSEGTLSQPSTSSFAHRRHDPRSLQPILTQSRIRWQHVIYV